MSRVLNEQKKILVWENNNLLVTTPSIPHVSKTDGGHLIVSPKVVVGSISELSDDILLEMFRLVGNCEKALIQVLGSQGVEIPFTNNQDNGNWSVLNSQPKKLHIHIYGRAKNSSKQKFGQALYCPDPNIGFYDDNEPLSEKDIQQIGEFLNYIYKS
jgi:diadenosine tetraphosphate (Ap4A) HIT family hydrolase